MQGEKDLYMPLFYNSLEITASLSDAEFGRLVRALLAKLGGRESQSEDDLPLELKIAYNFMLDAALRIIGRERKNRYMGTYKNQNKTAESEPKRYGNFDPKAAFEKALKRTYGKQEN